MISELVKKASAQGLSLTLDYKDNILSCDCIDEGDYSWYSYEGVDPIGVVMTINNFLDDPVAFTQRALSSIQNSEVIEVGA